MLKKLVILVSLFSFAFAVVGCGEQKVQEPPVVKEDAPKPGEGKKGGPMIPTEGVTN